MYVLLGYTRRSAVAKLFRSNRSQAVRLPKDAEFPPSVTDVEVVIEGTARILVPRQSMAEWLRNGPTLPDDFPSSIPDLPPGDIEPLS